jgi:hypothetical protein
MVVSTEHCRLVDLGARWLKRQGFPLVVTELSCFGNRERPDVYGCRQSCSVIIEVKVSRSDFLADNKKPERQVGGLGNYRLYLCPENMISIDELPSRWGLLYAAGKRIVPVHMPKGNMWLSSYYRDRDNSWGPFCHESDHNAERAALFSIARRLANGQSLC